MVFRFFPMGMRVILSLHGAGSKGTEKKKGVWKCMDFAENIRSLREQTGMNRKTFSLHTGIPVRTLEDWEAGRRTPPPYIPRLIAYQLKYEALAKKMEQESLEIEQ